MKPKASHPWTYQTWKKIQIGKENFWDYYRFQAQQEKISPEGRLRLEWIAFYHTVGKGNSSRTAAHFGISRKCLRRWLRRFNRSSVHCLEDKSKRPKQIRNWMVTEKEEQQVILLRKENRELGKKKLQVLYRGKYKENISTWRIERVMRKHKLFVEKKKKQVYMVGKTKQPRIRINKVKETLKKMPVGTLWHTDTILVWWYGRRRTIFTSLEDKTKLAFARVYPSATSANGADFLKRLRYLSNNKLQIIHSDNGAEFAKEFTATCQELGITQVFSRPHTPKDNPCLEKFNHTVQREWLDFSEVGLDDIQEANIDLTAWLVKYNSVRPHQALDYKTPLAYAYENFPQLVPMTPASSEN